MFSGFLVIFFIKFPNQLLKNSTHAVVIKTRVLEDRLKRHGGNQSAAGRELGMSPRMMCYKLKKAGIVR